MNAEIISVGTELLLGAIVNTNAAFLSQKLAENAVDIYHQTTVGDNVPRIVEAFRAAASRSDILIASGGLGPTEDDVTVKSAAEFLGTPLHFHKPTHAFILRRLETRQVSMTRLIEKQCWVPHGAFILQNENGTAPGIIRPFVYQNKKKWLVLLPGPPRELERLFTEKALPLLRRLAKLGHEHFLIRSLKISGLIEAQVAQKVTDLLKSKPPLTVGIYAKLTEVELKIMAKSSSLKKAKQMVDRVEKEIRKRLKDHVYGVDRDTLPSVVGDLLNKTKTSLATAESCTGGLLAEIITQAPGSSEYFFGGIIAYNNWIKTYELSIPQALIKKNGAVSGVIAKEMAQNVREIIGADYGIGITGIAGPSGGSPSKPVGLVYIAVAGKKRTVCREHRFLGGRGAVKSCAAAEALELLRRELLRNF